MQRIYRKVVGDGPEAPTKEKVKNVDDTKSKLQTQVHELQLK